MVLGVRANTRTYLQLDAHSATSNSLFHILFMCAERKTPAFEHEERRSEGACLLIRTLLGGKHESSLDVWPLAPGWRVWADVKGWRPVVERVQMRRLLERRVNAEWSQLLGSLIIHLGASCFLPVHTAGQLNCLEINSLACYWLHAASKVHFNGSHPITLSRDQKRGSRGLSGCWCSPQCSTFLFASLHPNV